MAPEYLVRGKLTEKVDVYSFGIVVMETVCGRSKTTRKATPDPLSLLQNVSQRPKTSPFLSLSKTRLPFSRYGSFTLWGGLEKL